MKNYPSIDLKATGARIRQLRKEKHLRVQDISDYMGFTEPQAVYKWQRGDSLPTVDNLYALSRLFDTSMENIIIAREEDERSSSFDVYGLLWNTAGKYAVRSPCGWLAGKKVNQRFIFFVFFSVYNARETTKEKRRKRKRWKRWNDTKYLSLKWRIAAGSGQSR